MLKNKCKYHIFKLNTIFLKKWRKPICSNTIQSMAIYSIDKNKTIILMSSLLLILLLEKTNSAIS